MSDYEYDGGGGGASSNGNGVATNGKPAKSDKRLSVERIYQKKTQLEHILLRPDTYIGSAVPTTEKMWVFDKESSKIVNREITFTPGLYKIFDEILVNAADNKQRDPKKMDTIKIDINPEKNEIKVYNNGKGIPVVMHKDEKMYVPTMIFGHLLTSSNFNDEDEKVTGGRNGYGAKLCNVFSTKFTVETSSKAEKHEFKQSWGNNMSKAGEAKIKPVSGEDFTRITFQPDLAKFSMERLDDDTVSLLSRRAYDIAASCKGVKVMLNGKRIPVKNFKEYVDFFLKGHEDENNCQIKSVYEASGERWEVAVALSDNGFQQMSFVNSIATTKGGRHVDYISKMVENNIVELVKKKNKGGVNIKPHQIRNHIWVFINCLIVNPSFDSQTKENMTLQMSKFGSKCNLSPKFFAQLGKSGIVESVLAWSKFKQDQEMKGKASGKKTNKLKGISKLEDANNAGTKNSLDCTLILTEGDSAKSLAVAGLSVIGRDTFGVYPLKGKVLNVREASHKQIMENKEISEMVKILGLTYKKRYTSIEDMKSLRYGKLMIMTDQDQDGSHIKGLLINFIHHNWPSLLEMPFLEQFITPIVKASKGQGNNAKSLSFFSLPEFNEWKSATDNWHTYKIKYYKGLGTSTSKEAKEYFSDMKRHRILFSHNDAADGNAITMAFSKKHIEQRKEWLTHWMEECKRRRELGLSEVYLYEKNTKAVTYADFVNKELVLFSNLDNERSIPSLVDGFKPGQRKVMFTCLKRNDKREVKVAQLAGSVGEMSAYHHGEASLMGTIINLAQNFVGSNNINLLLPNGQFGTRLAGGKDHASPRYIFTQLSPLARHCFNSDDDAVLNYLTDDNQKIEPEYYVPILPMVLVNGADGIGTGWMTKIPNFNPREIVRNLQRMLNGLEPEEMNPWFKGFTGSIESLDNQRYCVNGEIASISDNKIEITELPIRTWTQTYKEQVMEPFLNGSDKVQPVIQDYKEYHTDKTVKFIVQMAADKLRTAEVSKGLHQFFKVQSTISTSSMVLFDSKGCLRKYESANDILKEFYEVRLDFYKKRKDYLEGMLEAEAQKLSNQARFILEKCDGSLTVENKKKKAMIEELQRKGFDSDPVKKWKSAQEAASEGDAGAVSDDDNEEEDRFASDTDYDYLLGMPMWNLTKEKKDDILKKKNEKHQELKHLRETSKEDLWRKDLKELLAKLDEVEQKEAEDDMAQMNKAKGLPKGKGGKKAMKMEVLLPSPAGIRVQPRIPDELRKKAAAAATAKARKGKKAEESSDIKIEKDEFDMMCDDDELNKSLSERVGVATKDFKKSSVTAGAKRKKKEEDDDDDGSPKKKKKSTTSTPPKKSKKHFTESTSEEDDYGGGSDDDFDSPMVEKKERGVSRRAAANVKFSYSSNEEGSDSDDFLASSPPPRAAKPEAEKRKQAFDASSGEDSDAGNEFFESNKSSPKPEKSFDDLFKGDDDTDSSPIKKPAAKKDKVFNYSSDDGSDMDFDEAKVKVAPAAGKKSSATAAAKKPAAKKKKKGSDDDSDFNGGAGGGDDDFAPIFKKKPAPKKKPAAEKKPKKASPAKKPKKKNNFSDSEDNDDFSEKFDDGDDDSFVAEKKDRGGARRAAATKKYTYDSDNSSDDDFV